MLHARLGVASQPKGSSKYTSEATVLSGRHQPCKAGHPPAGCRECPVGNTSAHGLWAVVAIAVHIHCCDQTSFMRLARHAEPWCWRLGGTKSKNSAECMSCAARVLCADSASRFLLWANQLIHASWVKMAVCRPPHAQGTITAPERRMSWRMMGSCWGAALRLRNWSSAEGISCALRMLCADGQPAARWCILGGSGSLPQGLCLDTTYWASRRMFWRRVGSCWGAALRRRKLTSAEGTSCAARMLCADGASGLLSGPINSYVHLGSLRQFVSHSNIADTGSPAARCINVSLIAAPCCVCTYKEPSSFASMAHRKCHRINDVRQLEVSPVMLQRYVGMLKMQDIEAMR
jgi:hypothetical protein